MPRCAVTFIILLTFLCFSSGCNAVELEHKKSLTLTDVMKFNSIKTSKISDNGQWVAFESIPDFGDSTGYVQHINKDISYQVNRGTSPVFSDNNRFVGFIQPPSLLKKEQTSSKQRNKLTNELLIIDLTKASQQTFSQVKSYQFAHQSNFVAILVKRKTEKGNDENDDKFNEQSVSINDKKIKTNKSVKEKTNQGKLHNNKTFSNDLLIVNLITGEHQQIRNVHRFSFSDQGDLLAYVISTKTGEENRLDVLDLTNNKTTHIIQSPALSIAQLLWSKQKNRLGILSGDYNKKAISRSHQLNVWQSETGLKTAQTRQEGWFISDKHKLTWSFDHRRLFFGYSPTLITKEEKTVAQSDLFDIERILAKKEMQTWHSQDSKIKTQAAVDFAKDNYSYYLASFEVETEKIKMLADPSLQNISISKNSYAFIGLDAKPYQKQQTWNGRYYDVYRIDLKTAKKQLVVKEIQNSKAIKVSQNGRYISYFKEHHLWLFDSKKSTHRNLSLTLSESFVDEDNDRPEPAKAYGIYGWFAASDSFLAYDKFDLWLFDSIDGKATKLSSGRDKNRVFRIINTDPRQAFIDDKQKLLLSSFNTENKQYGFFELDLATRQLGKLVEGDKRYRFVAKAKNSENYLYTREDYQEFPDLWLGQRTLADTKQLSHLGEQTQGLLWGDSQLIEWKNKHGKRIQGRLITPENFDANKRYPVLVYFYENYSDRLNNFAAMKINHRPNFPYYSSNGYVIFQPDIDQIIGQPGDAMVQSIVPGVQKLIDMGIADVNAIALHGHSWGGYGTAYAITKTDIFAAAIAGAPVSNMTSAYSGIRLKSGMARQFQYETGQSRLAANLWQQRQLYINNSPLFFADKINTPLLIQFGDKDDAVPWQQGVELYMAMRRLNKDAVMLQYEGEPHHLKKYPNKLDYTIKVKQYLDHYLLGKPAPIWLSKGEDYRPFYKKHQN